MRPSIDSSATAPAGAEPALLRIHVADLDPAAAAIVRRACPDAEHLFLERLTQAPAVHSPVGREAVVRRALPGSPRGPEAMLRLGVMMYLGREGDDARGVFLRVVTFAPTFAADWYRVRGYGTGTRSTGDAPGA